MLCSRIPLLALIAGFAVCSAIAAHGQQLSGAGALTIGIAPIDLRSENVNSLPSDKTSQAQSDFIARTVKELLPNYIQRGAEKALQRRVVIVDAISPDAPPNFVISPSVVIAGKLGIRVTAKIAAFRATDATASNPNQPEEVLLLSSDTNFGEIDERMTDFGLRIAQRIADLSAPKVGSSASRLPRGIIGVYCIIPVDPADRRLQQIARLLAIELPFRLSEASRKRNLDLVVRGADLREAAATCESPSIRGTEYRIENFTWTGSLSRNPKEEQKANLVMRTRDNSGGGNFRPLQPLAVDMVPAVPSIADQLISNFVDQFERSQFRVFVHYTSTDLRKAFDDRVRKSLSDVGYNVVGTEGPGSDLGRPGIDYFFDQDCPGAAKLRQTLTSILPLSVGSIPLRKHTGSNNPVGTLGVWLSKDASGKDKGIETDVNEDFCH